jgi:hypothetical protein
VEHPRLVWAIYSRHKRPPLELASSTSLSGRPGAPIPCDRPALRSDPTATASAGVVRARDLGVSDTSIRDGGSGRRSPLAGLKDALEQLCERGAGECPSLGRKSVGGFRFRSALEARRQVAGDRLDEPTSHATRSACRPPTRR